MAPSFGSSFAILDVEAAPTAAPANELGVVVTDSVVLVIVAVGVNSILADAVAADPEILTVDTAGLKRIAADSAALSEVPAPPAATVGASVVAVVVVVVDAVAPVAGPKLKSQAFDVVVAA